MFTDTHCHIYHEYYDDIDKVINECEVNNVKYFINSGGDAKSNIEVLETIKNYPNMYAALGLHPEEAKRYSNEDIKFIENNLNNPKVLAIGEIGLDYHYGKESKDEQIKLFEKQLELAEKYNIPVIIHSRDATEDTINTLQKYNVKGTIHSFSGSLETARIYIKMGYLLGINGVITFKNSHLKEIIKEIDPSHIVLETDSPYLTPEPFRGTSNNPKHIKEIAEFVSELYDISTQELSEITQRNIKELYKL